MNVFFTFIVLSLVYVQRVNYNTRGREESALGSLFLSQPTNRSKSSVSKVATWIPQSSCNRKRRGSSGDFGMAATSRFIPSPSDPSPSNNVHDGLRSSSSSSVYNSADGASKTAEEVWKDINSSSSDRNKIGEGSCSHPPMTLEDYLAKEGIARENDGRIVALDQQQQQQQLGVGGSMMDLVMDPVYVQQPPHIVDDPFLGFAGGTGVGRGRKRLLEAPVDKIAQQKQRRMIKNRESAARSRERKQAYTMELETMVASLEGERVRLLQEQKEREKKRFDELMKTVVPVTGRRKQPLRRTRSMTW